jgi:hypothetical protein
MSALQVLEVPPEPVDFWVARLDAVLAELAAVVADCTDVPDAVRIDRIDRLERLRAVTAAAQAAECVRFAQSQVAEQLSLGVHPRAVGRGVADQIALACRIPPVAGSRRLGVARSLWFDLPQTFAQLTNGDLREAVAEVVVTETRHLDSATRRQVDGEVVSAGINRLGLRAAAACVRRIAYRADPHGYLERGRTERKLRRVGCRSAPDTMAVLTGYLPVEQGVACYAALRRHTDGVVATGDTRTRDQIMADTLVERLTGQARAGDVAVEVQLLVPLEALTKPGNDQSATLQGYGPLPLGIARDIVATSRGQKWWRRLFTAPPLGRDSGPLIGGDPNRRRFDGFVARLISARDQTCRDPYCDASIRHHDHITRHVDGGKTNLPGGRGVCARGNYVREMPGWRVEVTSDGLGGAPHATVTTTPTGHRYLSEAPQPP